MARKRIQPINPGAPQPVPESAPLPGFGRPINLVESTRSRPIQRFPSIGRPLARPDAIPLAEAPAPAAPPIPDTIPLAEGPPPLPMSPVGGPPPATPYPVQGDPYVNRNPAEARVSRFADPAASPRPGPGAYDAVKNASRGPAMPFLKPGSAPAPSPVASGPMGIAGPQPQGQLPAPGPARPAIPMGGPTPPPKPAPAGLAGPGRTLGLPAPGPSRPAIPLGGANAYTPPNAGGMTEAIGGATPNRTGRYAGAQRPPAGPNFNVVREPLGLPAPGPAPDPFRINLGRGSQAPPEPPNPFDVRTAQRGGNFSRAGVKTPGSFRQTYGGTQPLRPVQAPSRIGSAIRSAGPMVALGAAADPEGFASAVGHPLQAIGGAIASGVDGVAGIFDGRFRKGLGRLTGGDPEAWKYAAANAPVLSQVFNASANIGEGGAAFLLNPSEASASFGRGLSKIGNAFSGPSAPPSPAAPSLQAPASAEPGPGATADQLNAFWQSQGVGAGKTTPGPQPGAPAQPAAPRIMSAELRPSTPSGNGTANGTDEQRQMAIAHRTMNILSRQLSGLQDQFDRYQNPEMRAGIAESMARVAGALQTQQEQARLLGTAPAERRLMDAKAVQAENDNRPPGEKLDAIMKDERSWEAFLVSKGYKPEEIPAMMERFRANSQAANGGQVASQTGGQIDQQSYPHVLRGNQYLDGLRPLFDPTHAGFQANMGLSDILDRAMPYPGAREPNSLVSQVIREGIRGRYPGDAMAEQVKTLRNNPKNWFFGDSTRDAKYRNYLRSIGLSEVPEA